MIDLQPDLELTKEQAQRVLEAWLGGPIVCSNIQRLEGGLVNTVLLLEFDRSPCRAVVKLHRSRGDKLAAEARALRFLRSETACPVPEVYLQDSSAHIVPYGFLLLEHLPGDRLSSLDLDPDDRADIEVQLAEVLGELHSHHGKTWGGVGDTEASDTWTDIFVARLADARSHPAVSQRLTPDTLAKVDDAILLARGALGDPGVPTLVHGDVWDGNLMVRLEDHRWRLTGLLDPDLQYADVEYELAYLEVFDDVRDAFFAAYAKYQALRPGFEQRRLFYWLHTALVHVALFGDERYRRYASRTAEEIGRLSPPPVD